jgi:coenzyme F420 hydrogenase subunit beta
VTTAAAPGVTGKKPRWTGDWSDLSTDVLATDLCTGCSGCIVACPHDVLKLDESSWRPFLDEEAAVEGDLARCVHGERGCTLCTRACPRFRLWELDADAELYGRARTPDEVAGIYQDVYLVEATSTQIAEVGQDGGFGTALLWYAMVQGYIDGALVSYFDENWGTRPGVATTLEELISAAGSRYTYSANTLAMREAEDLGLSRLGFVSMGCQTSVAAVSAARGARKLSGKIALTVGLLCSKTFGEDIFEGLLEDRYGVARREVTKINIKGRLQVWLDRDGSPDYLEVPLKEAREWTRPGCKRCPDFGAEHADISLGGIVTTAGRTLTIVRTDLGHELLALMARDGWINVYDAVEEDPEAIALMRKLATAQRKRWPSEPSAGTPHPEPAVLPTPRVGGSG